MKTYQKMNNNNVKIRKALSNCDYHNFKQFPHTRGSKDWYIEDVGFDMICFNHLNVVNLVQCKTNQAPNKEILNKFIEIEKKYNINCLWVSVFDKYKDRAPKKYKGKIMLWFVINDNVIRKEI